MKKKQDPLIFPVLKTLFDIAVMIDENIALQQYQAGCIDDSEYLSICDKLKEYKKLAKQ